MKNKLIGILLLAIGLLGTGCFFGVAAHAQSQIALGGKVPKDGDLLPVNFHKVPDGWDSYGLEKFLGNHLTDSGEITPQTSLIEFSKDTPAGYDVDMKISDVDTGDSVASFSFAEGNAVAALGVVPGTLLSGHEYQVFVGQTPARECATFIVAAPRPTIVAASRSVIKDDPNFNIMEGVTAHDYEGNDITSKIVADGKVDIHKIGVYPVTYSVKDKEGGFNSISINITVQNGVSPLTPPVLDEVTDTDTKISGTGVPGTNIYVILGTDAEVYRGLVNTNGKFDIHLERSYPAGTSITAYLEDDQGNKSAEVYSTVKVGGIAVGVNEVLSSDTSVTGVTAPDAQVQVAVDNALGAATLRDHLFYGTADSSGNYTVDMKGFSYPAGTKILVTATLQGKSGSKSVIVYPKKVSINTATAGDKTVYGKADPNATVHLSIKSKDYQANADAAGNFYISLDEALMSGDRITAYQISNDMKSENVTVNIN